MTRPAVLALLALLAAPAAASAADLAPPLAASSYWKQFGDYWLSRFREQSGMVLAVLGVGAVAIGIIVFGKKWK
jgi:DMSO reductase anchor subunit